ncbi:MAG: HipA domain-containing protein [bacterium]
MSEPTAVAYVELGGATRLVGRLFVSAARGRESATFEYDESWIAAEDRFALEPALIVSAGPYHTAPGRMMFGALGDSAPDRWGQTLLRRDERRRAKAEGRAPHTLRDIDFLLGVTDTVRQGALRFAAHEGGEFLAAETGVAVPPLVDLPRLLAATDRFSADEESADDLRLLLAPGSSLGGARPKASVRDIDGTLLIAKFPKPDDEYRVVAWEAVALELARRAGIPVEQFRLDDVADREVLLVHRFDRQGTRRVPFLSAMSMLGSTDGEPRSYPEIADALRAHGAAPRSDLPDLWRRMVFSVLISNTDDHLRNHGFLYAGGAGWRLSPAYDLNPVPVDIRPRVLSTPIAIDLDPTASIDLAIDVAEFFDLTPHRARAIAADVASATRQWRDVAMGFGIRRQEIDRMESAFEHADLTRALAWCTAS